jgi:acyl-CoA synthetase (AMP-forming)/AMP-acid ligase II
MFHANGWGMPVRDGRLGVPQVVLRKVDGAEMLRRVERYGVTVMCAAPAVVAAVLDAAASWDGPVPGRDRTRVIVAGAPPPSRTIQRIEEELGWEFLQIYGLTETTPLLTVNRRRAEEDELPAEERARRLGGPACPPWARGSPSATPGRSWRAATRCSRATGSSPRRPPTRSRDGWFHTATAGRSTTRGYLSISDRKKDVIITGGENVSSIEVEDCLFSHPAVAEVAVIGVPSEKWGETIKALVVLAEGTSADEPELIAHCKARLAGYKAPTSVEFREVIPRTATGKVQKFKLRQQYWEGQQRQIN